MSEQSSSRQIAAGVFWGLVLFFIVLPLVVALAAGACMAVLYVSGYGSTAPRAQIPVAKDFSKPPPDTAGPQVESEEEPAQEDPADVPEEAPPPDLDEVIDRHAEADEQAAVQPEQEIVPQPEPPEENLGPLGARLSDVSTIDDERRKELEIPPGIIGGVLVVEVLPDSPAFRAGVQADDLLTHLGAARLRDLEQLDRWLARYGIPGALGQLHLSRRVPGRERRLVKVVVAF